MFFFYLDAHWRRDLPLRQEVEEILTACADAIGMIDDCRVEGDTGYGFDDYGDGQAISLEYIWPVSEPFDPRAFVPVVPTEQEAGARRGCMVLVGPATKLPADGFRTLRGYPISSSPRIAASIEIAAVALPAGQRVDHPRC
jgi:hypothetical protein